MDVDRRQGRSRIEEVEKARNQTGREVQVFFGEIGRAHV